jgi:hypothetical protein
MLASLAAVTDATPQPAAAFWRPRLPRRGLALALAALVALAAALALALAPGSHHAAAARAARSQAARASPPAAGGAPTVSPGASASGPAGAVEVRDPQEASSFPAPAGVRHAAATTPSKAGEAVVAAGAPSDAEVRAELQQMQAAERSAQQLQRQRLAAVPGGRSIGGNGTIPIPQGVPEVVQRVIAGANAIADFPYVFGGGHASFVDNAYDCSGSVSYALAAGGLLGAPETPATWRVGERPAPGATSRCSPTPGTPTCTWTGSCTTRPGAAACTPRAGRPRR